MAKIELKEEINDFLHGEIGELKLLLEEVLREVKSLRRERLPSSPEKIENLLRVIHEIFENSEWTAVDLLECLLESENFLTVISKTIGSRPTVKKVSRFLRQCVGSYGSLTLELIDSHSRQGALFQVVTK